MPTDSVLLQRYAATRDAEAFAEIVRRHAGLVFGVCRRICGNAADAEDIAQDCFLKLARHADQIRSSLPAWLHTVAVHAASRAIGDRRGRRQEALHDGMPVERADAGEPWTELMPHIDAALAQLPAEQREALVLRYLEDRSQEDIARAMGLSQPTVSRRLNDGIAELRRLLGPMSAQALPVLVVHPPVTLTASLGKMGMAGIGAPSAAVGAGGAGAGAGSLLAAGCALALLATGILAWSPWMPRVSPPGAPTSAASTPLPARTVLAAGWQLQDAAKVAAGGDQLSRTSFAAKDWYPATVPGTVLTTLVDNRVYPEPLYGENNRPERIPEALCRTDWWYRTTVAVPAAYAGKRIWLDFDGINYAAEVWVNGRRSGPIQGAFIRGIFDITAQVEAGKDAAIAVRVSPQPHRGIPAEHTIGAGNGPIGGVTGLDGPTFACSIGWDWQPGIRDRDTGIWQKVSLSASGAVVIKDPQVVTALPLPRTDSATITVQATLRNTTDQAQKGVLRGSIGGIAFERPVALGAWNAQAVVFDAKAFPQLQITNPRLWWPNGLGEPNLYALHLSFEIDGVVSDAQDTSFGIREFSYDVPGSDKLALSVNGVRVFCKGGNWGMDEALKRIPRERLEAQVRMHQLANFNMIRNWGGQSTSDDLYDLCDRYGIMLWDEFFQFNSVDPFDTDLYLANVRDKIVRCRNHPCVAVWCGRNEATPPKYLDDAVRYLLTDLDPTRWYQSNSGHGRGCNSGGPYDWQKPTDYYRFAELKNFNKDETFKTEIGAISVPTLESIQGMMPEKDWNTINDDWAEHDFTAGGGRKYPGIIAERYGVIANLADFVRKSQMMNYEGYRAMYEGRQARMFAPVQGILTWMSHPSQPSFVWQIYHYDLEPNAALFAVRKACEPVHLQLREDGIGTVQVIDNLPTAFAGKATVVVIGLDGSSLHRQDYTVAAAGCATTDLGPVAWPANLSVVHFVKLELRDAAGKLVSDSFIWRGAGAKPDDLTALAALPTATLEATVAPRAGAAGKLLLDVALRNTSAQPALMAHLQLRRKTSGERVLPAFYSDNYISFAPKEERTITIEASAADLKGDKPLIVVDGWNIGVKPVATAAAEIALNANAQISRWPQTGFGFAEPKIEPAESFRLNCGGFARDGFIGDPGILEGTPGWSTEPIDTGAPMAAPEAIYQTVHWGACSYAFPLTGPAQRTYTVRLHFAEWVEKAAGKRVFDVFVNGRAVLTDLDVFQEAGRYKALVKQVTGIARGADGIITVSLSKATKGTPQICGIEIVPDGTAK